jgi:hypothetical protein
MITKETCGIALTSEQVMWFLEHPEEFEAFKSAHGVGESQEETTDEAQPSEADTTEPTGTSEPTGQSESQDNDPFPGDE